MNSHLHHAVVLARLADFRRAAELRHNVYEPRPAPGPRRASRRAAIRRRVLRTAA